MSVRSANENVVGAQEHEDASADYMSQRPSTQGTHEKLVGFPNAKPSEPSQLKGNLPHHETTNDSTPPSIPSASLYTSTNHHHDARPLDKANNKQLSIIIIMNYSMILLYAMTLIMILSGCVGSPLTTTPKTCKGTGEQSPVGKLFGWQYCPTTSTEDITVLPGAILLIPTIVPPGEVLPAGSTYFVASPGEIAPGYVSLSTIHLHISPNAEQPPLSEIS